MPALPLLWLEMLNQPAPQEWRLAGADFPVLRGAYQQNFELSCQALPLLVAIQNAADGRPATRIQDDSQGSAWIPSGQPVSSKPPRTLDQFKRLNAEAKEAFLDQFPTTEANWVGMFDRGIRNAIAHADVDQVAATGEIVTGRGAVLAYMRFVESVAKQIQLLLLWLNLAKILRVYNLLADHK
jgi:hypothetical protein